MPLGPKNRFSSGSRGAATRRGEEEENRFSSRSRGAATRRGEEEEGSDTLILERCVDDLGGANAKSNEVFPATRWQTLRLKIRSLNTLG
jgi:hypothetical protein